ncbi:F-box protein [Sesamum alatum]|uniref:F-box protein n=1 Tax=Sesamum alatum TaxID=300844 RepID=A0AAE1Y4P1_9LAMI|nr:F-box protein [Sesamum alatum]
MEKEKKRLILKGSLPLHEEIILFEIFSRLPVKSLCRFRLVCKFCCSLTSNPQFRAATRSRGRRRFFLSFSSALNWNCVLYSLTPGFHGVHVPEIADSLADAAYCYYIRCINGLACFVRGDIVVVCNLATDEKPILQPFPGGSCLDRHSYFFCYDPETDKYKVLRSVSSRIHGPVNDEVAKNYKIFTVGVDIAWRDIYWPGLYQLGKSTSVCVNGVLFCSNFSVSSRVRDGVIAAFDVRSEYFDTVKYPDGLSSSRHSSCHLIEAKGSVGIVVLESCVIRLWIKEKGFVSGSWLEHRIEFPSQWRTDISLSYNFSFSSNSYGEMIMGSSRMSTP